MTFAVDMMKRALALAEAGRGRCNPEPLNGCVIERDGAVLGEGARQRRVGQSAEAAALAALAVDTDCAGAWAHCVIVCDEQALLEAGVDGVVYALESPGLETLNAAGVKLEQSSVVSEARKRNQAALKYAATGLPFVTAKWGVSLDGNMATRTGDSQGIVSAESREYMHRLRDEADAIIIGSHTVIQDDPQLTTRLSTGRGKDAIRVIVVGHEGLPPGRRVFNQHSTAPTWIAAPAPWKVPEADEVLVVSNGSSRVDFTALIAELGRRGLSSVLVEGGSAIHASALAAGVVDRVLFFFAPLIIGGYSAIPAVGGQGVPTVADGLALEGMTARQLGPDILIEAFVSPRHGSVTD